MSNTPVSLALGRFKRLALRSNDTWQGGIFRLPAWVGNGPQGRPVRPWGALWVSERTGLIHLEPEPKLDAHSPELALTALIELGLRQEKHLGGRAATLLVTDHDLAAFLATRLEGTETTIEVVEDLPAVRDVLRHLAKDMADDPRPGILESPGVTVERLRSFAGAAARFFEAAPWEHLQNEDLIRVHAPKAPRGMTYFSVMGNAGQEFGLAFFNTRAEFDTLTFGTGDFEERFPDEVWGCYFDEIDGIPIGDADAWEEHGLPLAGPSGYPWAMRAGLGPGLRRPNARELAFLEALLLAIATTTEAQLDEGEWSVDVDNCDGRMTVKLSLPLLLEAEREAGRRRVGPPTDRRAFERGNARIGRFLEQQEFESLEQANEALQKAMHAGLFDGHGPEVDRETLPPLERAQELVYDAFEVTGRLRTKLARQALVISPDCADAWTLLAEASSKPERAREYYQQAVEAGKRALGPQAFQDLAGHFWGHTETRPYMRARMGLAQTLDTLGEHDAAIDHYKALLELNPGDNQGVRYILLAALLTLHRDDEAGTLLREEEYKGDIAAEWQYGDALSVFRREGDTSRARTALSDALRANSHVASMLLDPDSLPDEMPDHFALGSPEEAAACVALLRDAWETTPGALEWLKGRTPRSRARRTTSRRPRARRRK